MARVKKRSKAMRRTAGRKPTPDSRFCKYKDALYWLILKFRCEKICELATGFLKTYFDFIAKFFEYGFWLAGASFCVIALLSVWAVDSEGYEYRVYYKCSAQKALTQEQRCMTFLDSDLEMMTVQVVMPLATLTGMVGSVSSFLIKKNDIYMRRLVGFPFFAAGYLTYEVMSNFDICMQKIIRTTGGLTYTYTNYFNLVPIAILVWVLNGIVLLCPRY